MYGHFEEEVINEATREVNHILLPMRRLHLGLPHSQEQAEDFANMKLETMCVCVFVCVCLCLCLYTCTLSSVYLFILRTSQANKGLEEYGLRSFSGVHCHYSVTPTLHLFCHGTGQLQHLLRIPVWQ